MFGKNDVYVVFRVGTKKVKTHHKRTPASTRPSARYSTMNLEDHDLEHGIDVGAYDYDVGSSDDLLGQGKLVNLLALKRTPNLPVQGAVQVQGCVEINQCVGHPTILH